MNKSHFGLVLVALCWCFPVFGQGLTQIYDLAVTNDPQLRAAYASLQSVREAKPQAMAQLRPAISLQASMSHNRQQSNGASSFGSTEGYYDRSSLSLNLAQPLYRPDYWIQLEQSDRLIAQAEAEYVAAQQELMVRVSQAYFDVLAAQDTLEFTQAEKLAIVRQLDQASQRFEVGLIAITAVHEAQAAFDKARADVIQAENNVGDAKEALQEIIGEYQDELLPLSIEPPLSPPDPMDIAQWSNNALEQNLSLIALRNATEVAKQNIELQHSGHSPRVELVGGHSINSSSFSGSADTDTTSIGLEINLPLYSGGGTSSRTRQARHDYQEAQELLDQQRRSVNRQVKDAYRGVVSSISRVKALKAATVSAKSALDATEAGFEVGTRTMVDVLDEQRDLYLARRDYSHVRYGYIMNGLRLKFAAGSIQRGDLDTINAWLKR